MSNAVWSWADVQPATGGAPDWRAFLGGNKRPSGGGLTRFVGTSSHASQQEATLRADHPAVTGGTTLFPRSIVDPQDSPRLLVSGVNSAKLGRVVLKGPWRDMPIYLLTLVERETCPATCGLWGACFGNAMPFARRHRYTPDLIAHLAEELRTLAARHRRTGFVVRLHNLGDFPDRAYVDTWLRWMRQMPQIHVFGYTAHPAESEIGCAINLGAARFPERWMIRFSVAADDNPQPMQATTIWRKPDAANVQEGLVCPAQTHRTAACATCGLCWHPAAAGKRIVFIGHGMKNRQGR